MKHINGSLTQLVECLPYTQDVGSSSLSRSTKIRGYNSGVECFLAKENVVGSNPTTRSNLYAS